ncbi:MAG: aminotransferase class V-fold PLP-dependent enzyme [Lachnospiraceae bacterium]|nr:aminotransferase class V-fold PLP-dependent enzyme [Lachnospiraceae bacterium]
MQLIRKLKEIRDSRNYPFHMPGHKRMQAADDLLAGIYGIDVTEVDDLDNLHDAKGILREAENHAAAVFGSYETHFLVNGSTGGILAAITGSVTEKDTVIVAGNCHRSVFNAIMLSGAACMQVMPQTETFCDIAGSISPESVAEVISKCDRSNRIAVVITSPTYEGITSDIEAIYDVCHKAGALLIVDAAHGAHLGFSDRFPPSPIGIADVVVTSVHKTLPAMTQTALIHIKEGCPAAERIRKMLTVFMTSSPSYVLMASIDSLAYLLEERGEELFDAYVSRLDDFYSKAENFENLSVLCSSKLTTEGSDHDRSKIVITDLTGSMTGKNLADELHDRYDISIEMAADTYVILMTSIADTDEGFARLYDALCAIDEKIEGSIPIPASRGIVKRLYDRIVGKRIRNALFDDNREYVLPERSEGRTAADFVTVYPPGIPVMIPGEVITAEAAKTVAGAIENGLYVMGLNDGKIAVTWEKYST